MSFRDKSVHLRTSVFTKAKASVAVREKARKRREESEIPPEPQQCRYLNQGSGCRCANLADGNTAFCVDHQKSGNKASISIGSSLVGSPQRW